MNFLLYKSFSLSCFQMLIVIITLLGAISSVYSGVDSDPYSTSGDDLGLYDPFYDSNNPSNPTCQPPIPPFVLPIYKVDMMQLQFAQNIEHLEAEFFLWGALGYGLDKVAPQLTLGGPPPIGVRKANLDNFTEGIITEFGFEEVGHLRALKRTVGGIPRPLMDLSQQNFARVVNQAFESDLKPPFDPYRDSLSYMLASYIIPYMGLTGYVGANPQIKGYVTKRLLSGLLGNEAGQDAVIRMYLYERRMKLVHPYNFTVAEFTNRISILRNKLGMCGIKDEGVVVPPELGAEGRTSTNVLSANQDSLSYARTPAEILRVLYETGNEHHPGGFYPKGANGEIARMYLKDQY
ncbi:desiccation-related protein PCC13-62-like [Chenopodium quinoa]|uniref:desiccation-related protein PCC13-62-like n=1 Tax=Chenopodium quinoa TaxID=63459 RepID=UPI000B777C20|nr:desiccation-related protein PCC13-62-like [Chenopodium quinoa]